jgi:hypothetical protein
MITRPRNGSRCRGAHWQEIEELERHAAMQETTFPTALSTLVQVSATLAALIGFLGLWKLDQIKRAIAQHEMTLRDLMERATGGGGPIVWTGIVELATKIANTPESTVDARYREYQTPIQNTLELWQTSLKKAWPVKATSRSREVRGGIRYRWNA